MHPDKELIERLRVKFTEAYRAHCVALDAYEADSSVDLEPTLSRFSSAAFKLAPFIAADRLEALSGGEAVAWRYEYKPGRFHISSVEAPGYQPLYAAPRPMPGNGPEDRS